MNNILVIEDDLSIRESITELLSHKKYKVTTAKNGEEGMLMVKQGQPDLVICDVMMPGKDGYEVLKAIRADATISNTPFVFLTAKAQQEDVRGGMKLGADDYLIKPFKAQDLFDAVESRLARQAQYVKEYSQKLKIVKPLEQELIAQGLVSPLEGIVEFSKMLMTHFDRYSKQEIQNFIKRISTSAFSLNKKISSIILFQGLEEAKYNPKVFKKFAGGTTKITDEIIRAELIKVGKAYDRELDLFLQGIDVQKLHVEPENLKHILVEIFDNAFKYSNKGDLVNVNGYVDNKFYQLDIENKGKLINTDALDLDGKTGLSVGLGLPIARRIMEMNDGKLHIVRTEAGKNRISLRFKMA